MIGSHGIGFLEKLAQSRVSLGNRSKHKSSETHHFEKSFQKDSFALGCEPSLKASPVFKLLQRGVRQDPGFTSAHNL